MPVGSLTSIIDAVVNVYRIAYGIEPEDINCGLCEEFADDVCRFVAGSRKMFIDELSGGTLPSHAVIVYGGIYYDAECPTGSADWHNLIRR